MLLHCQQLLLPTMLFMLLLAVIGVLTHETLTSPPLREGRFISAMIGCGMIEGVKENGAFAFRGIPYAKAPLDELRWQPAQLIDKIEDCWNGTLPTHNSSTVCTQRLENGTTIGNEDCLYLDVVTPQVRYSNSLPVVVLIGAETLMGPSPGILRPSARYARSRDVIFVRPNFRLGIFGFLALEDLTKDANPRSSGNYALTDIIAVLKWIQLNIMHFGGDAKSVTLLGHRAGATLVSALVSSNQLDGLYTRAWASSASAIYPGKPLQESERLNVNLMATLDCQDAACLRETSSEKLWAATPDTWFNFPVDLPKPQEQTNASRHEWLVLDGIILQQHPNESWKQATTAAAAAGASQTQQPKLVMGATAHEAHTPRLRELHANWTAEEVRQYLQASQLGSLGLTDEVIELYNATNYAALVAIITDIRTVCPLLTNVRLQPSVPLYVVTQGEGDDQLATVDADVQAILGRYEPHTVEQRRFVSAMQQLFYYYVSHGTVQSFDSRRRVINVGQDAVGQLDHKHCNYWIAKDIVPQLYNATNYAALVAIITDIRTVCPLLTNVRLQPSVPLYVVTQGEGDDQLATVDADVQAILGRYEPHTVEQRRFVSAMQQLFYYYVSHGTVQSFDSRRRVINVGQDAVGQLDHKHCNYWIAKDIVPRYARTD
ncbi:hypothetical protein KR093_011355 [Drosophila rubida]|uniref:Carboxylesterase type B domain-containing protein n=1 Tax=Drosophila rubida TaxID=30044 RepID=A0AAD4PL65_9MUSC|nr:hypothetical protein KR093_011355 [Drosophila rubida]